MSENKLDRRVRRTRDSLGDALVALMQEKPYGEITVQEVLERADVGRSTFYSHFSDKDDLFLSDVDEFFARLATHLSRAREASRRVAPVRELFAHVAEARAFYGALLGSGKIHDVLEIGRRHFALGIEERLAELAPGAPPPPARGAVAHALAGALLAQLSHWLQAGTPTPAVEQDALFHRLVWRGVLG